MAKYIHGYDVLQEINVAIPVDDALIYPDLVAANKCIPKTAKEQRILVTRIISWMQENNAPVEYYDFVAHTLGSKIDKMWDCRDAEILVGFNGAIFTLKNIRIIDGIEEVLKTKSTPS